MAKMTKAQARKRLDEASVKLLRVYIANPGRTLSTSDLNELARFAQGTLVRLSKKLK